MRNNKRSIAPLIWIMLFDHTSLNITFPVLTLLFFDANSHLFPVGTSLAVRSMWYGACVSTLYYINIIATPILSTLSDGFGRKKVLLVGTIGAFLFAITGACGVLWGSLSLLFLGRFIQGAFSRTNPVALAIIGDISPSDKKVIYMGYLQTAISIGAFLGPIIGGYFANRIAFETFNFSLPYFIAAAFALLSVVLTLFFFEETLVKTNSHSIWHELSWQTIKKIVTHKKVLCISTVLLLTQVSWSTYYQFMPPVLKTLFHFDAHQLGLFVGLIALWLMVATTIGIKLLDTYFDLHAMLLISTYLVLFGLLLTNAFYFFHLPLTLIWVAAIPIAVGDVIAYSCLTALYSDVVEKSDQGKVMGVCFIVISLIWALTGTLGGLLMSASPFLPLMVAPLGIILAIVLLHGGLMKGVLSSRV